MACLLFGAKQLSEPMLAHCQVDPVETKLNEILVQVQSRFIQENAFANVRHFFFKCQTFCSSLSVLTHLP